MRFRAKPSQTGTWLNSLLRIFFNFFYLPSSLEATKKKTKPLQKRTNKVEKNARSSGLLKKKKNCSFFYFITMKLIHSISKLIFAINPKLKVINTKYFDFVLFFFHYLWCLNRKTITKCLLIKWTLYYCPQPKQTKIIYSKQSQPKHAYMHASNP